MNEKSRAELFEILNLLLDEDLAWFELRTPTAYIRIGDGPQLPNPDPHIRTLQGDNRASTGSQMHEISGDPPPLKNPTVASAVPLVAAAPAEAPIGKPVSPAADGHPVTAPFAGVFYRRPSPTEPPFVEVGTRVRTTDTVCLVEVMKLFNSVQAGIDGIVTAIHVEDGEIVEYGQLLMQIAPDAT